MESFRIKSDRHTNRITLSIVAALLLALACAEVGPPPGGEEDKSSPFLVGSSPANGATDVEIGDRAVLYFSERIVKPRSATGVFISPRQAEPARLKWKSDHLIIEFADSFAVDQTYIISVSSEITDLRNNRLDSSLVVAFSTGPTIDSGAVSGVVNQGDQPRGGVMVALYEPGVFDDTVPLDSIYPRYVTESNRSGLFSFQYLPSAEYRLLAFQDKSRDERYNPAFESYAVPDRAIDLSDLRIIENLNLPVTSTDTTTPGIISATFTQDRTLRLRLSREIDVEMIRENLTRLLLRPHADTSTFIAPLALQNRGEATSANLVFYMLGEVPDGAYRLQFFLDFDQPPLTVDSFVIAAADDGRRPEMSFTPDSLPRFIGQFDMVASFSEPLDTAQLTDETFLLSDAEGNRQKLNTRWEDVFTLNLTAPEMLPGNNYTLSVAEFEIADLAGNVMGDSLSEFTVVTIDDDSLGSVSGDVQLDIAGKADDPITLTFHNIGTRQDFELDLTERSFKIDLPAGKYLLSGFIDSNSNGKRDLGSVIPYTFSETKAAHPDTVAVRARFETAGITFNIR